MPDLDQLKRAIARAAHNAAVCRAAGDDHGETENTETVERLNLLLLRAETPV